jgi:hypothetical protein
MSADTFGSTPAIGNGATRTWVFTLGGAVVGGCAVAGVLIALSSASGLPASAAWQQAASSQAVAAFGLQAGSTRTRMLRGINGETLGEAGLRANADITQGGLPDTEVLSPAAWDRLSAGNCISLTTASGQKLSFRIMGARNVEAHAQAAPGNIDLAVTACAPGGDAVLKAIIEPKDEGKENAVQRSL